MVQLEIIQASSVFNSLNKNEIEEILKNHIHEVLSYKKDEIIVKDHDNFKRLGIVLKGKAAVLKSNINGRDTNFSILKQSDVFGMNSIFNDSSFTNSIKALNSVTVLYFDEDVFKDIILNYPEVSLSYIKLLTRKINFLTERIDTYLSNEKSDGLYDYLLNQSRINQTDEIVLDISLSKLANMLHMSRSSLYRSFDELIENKLITKDNRTIKILGAKK